MDSETMSHAADAFFTTKPPGKGTGLGLALCHSIIDGLDGKISMESTVGQGTRIDVYMPLNSDLDEASTA